MISCRLCVRPDPHVHESDTRVRGAQLPPARFALNIKRITRVDFALPAIKQGGKWWIVTHDVLDLVWATLRSRLPLRLRPSENEEQDPEQDQDEYR